MNKYKIIKPFPERNWNIGEIVSADATSAEKLLVDGYVEPYTGDEENNHIAITVDPVKLSANNNN